MYLAEIAPASKRGAFVTGFQFSVTIGTLIAYLINASLMNSGDWRLMLFLAVVPAGFQLVALFFLPESPKWLGKMGQDAKAKKVLKQLYGENLSQAQIEDNIPNTSTEMVSWKDLLKPSLRYVLGIGVTLCILQQFVGINAVIYFTPAIFQEAGFATAKNAMLATLIVGCVNFLATFCSIFLMDRLGRRKLLLISQLGVTISLVIFILSFVLEIKIIELMAVLAILTYVASYSLGLGPVTWVLVSEIYPTKFRAKAMSVMTFLSWLSNYIVVLTFPSLMNTLGTTMTFSLYLLISVIAYFFFLRYIPETKGKTLEQLEAILHSKKRS